MSEHKIAKITKSKLFTLTSVMDMSEWLRDQALAGYEYVGSTPMNGWIVVFVKEV